MVEQRPQLMQRRRERGPHALHHRQERPRPHPVHGRRLAPLVPSALGRRPWEAQILRLDKLRVGQKQAQSFPQTARPTFPHTAAESAAATGA